MMRLWRWGVLAVAAGAVGLWVTRPQPLAPDALAGMTGDPVRGATIYAAAGCASCHLAPEMREGPLAGGRSFATAFGTFYAPNISTDPQAGIGEWSDVQLASAIMRGVTPQGAHIYPAFPYTTYQRAEPADIVDLIAHLRSLPADPTPSRPHDLSFPFNIRATLGGWKWLFADPDWIMQDPATPQIARGRYLVEALGHCGECHTPRNALGGSRRDAWLTGAPNPSGSGRIPGIDPSSLDWSAEDIAIYLASGFTPEYDSAGGSMAEVIDNTSQLSDEDRAAIAAYLKALP